MGSSPLYFNRALCVPGPYPATGDKTQCEKRSGFTATPPAHFVGQGDKTQCEKAPIYQASWQHPLHILWAAALCTFTGPGVHLGHSLPAPCWCLVWQGRGEFFPSCARARAPSSLPLRHTRSQRKFNRCTRGDVAYCVSKLLCVLHVLCVLRSV